MQRRKRNEEGFTLIELLAVLLIIGILAAIGIPQYFRAVEKTRVSEGVKYLKVLQEAQHRYCLRNAALDASPYSSLDITLPALTYFDLATVGGVGTCDSYTYTTLRNGFQCTTLSGNLCAATSTIAINQTGAITYGAGIPVTIRP